jgi:Sulfotransferase family
MSRPIGYAPPVVVFGTGGSGTRGLQRLLDTAGYFMGTNVNRPGDALDIAWFIRRWLDRYLDKSGWAEAMWREGRVKRFRHPGGMAPDFRATIDDHREEIGRRKKRWGWKVPRTILVFPFVHEFFPGMRAIHLVRDGRDMAYSANQNQAQRYAAHFLEPSERDLPAPIQSISFWARANLAAARYGEAALGDRYLRLRYEEVCADPAGLATQLVEFLDTPKSVEVMQEVAASEIQPSSSIGRWRKRDTSEIAELESAGDEALRAFGYT